MLCLPSPGRCSLHEEKKSNTKNSHEAHYTVGVRVSGPLCRDPHVLLVADAELDLDLEIMLDLKSFRGSVL